VYDQRYWAPGEGRYHWTVTAFDEPDPVAARRTGELAEARAQAEGALLAYVEAATGSPMAGPAALANTSLARLYCRVLDAFDYWLTQARLSAGR
jgi:hypothetical protein